MSASVSEWKVSGDWFDACKCNIPCPCTFAQAPSDGECQGLMAYHINSGHYGETPLDGFNVMFMGSFTGNAWAGESKDEVGAYFFDERANEKQREALQMIFLGKAGGWIAEFVKLVGDIRGIEFVPIKFELAKDLAYWSAEIPGKVVARAEALTGPTTPPGKRVQILNPPGSEVGPGSVATLGRALADEVNAMGFKWDWKGRSSKHFPFDWRGP
jgi:hypothetical protein